VFLADSGVLEEVWRQILRSTWKDFDTRFKYILRALQRHKSLIESQATVIHFQQYQSESQFNRDRIDTLVLSESQRKHRETLVWISGGQAKPDHQRHCTTREPYPGSGNWILKDEKLKNWMTEDIPKMSTLWVNGKPGAGEYWPFYRIPQAALKFS
jgi:hypothetical protein